jgi:hypothetical protein
MPKQDKDINSSKEIQDKQDNKNHKWSVWTQGPNDAKETTRKFKQTTPGQVRDYKHFVNKRRFQKFEQVESVQPKNEDAPANAVAHGGVDMAPNAKGTKVFMKKYRVDGRTKEYREANRRIKERQEKLAQKQVQAKLDMFGVHANPFAEETENKKYLETKPGSIEDAVLNALNPNADKETLTLPKKNEEEVEEGFGKLKDASKNLDKMRKAAGVKVDKQTTTKLPSGGTLRKTTYKKADEANEGPERRKIDLGGTKRKTDKPKKIPFATKAEEKEMDEEGRPNLANRGERRKFIRKNRTLKQIAYDRGELSPELKRNLDKQKANRDKKKAADKRNADYFAKQRDNKVTPTNKPVQKRTKALSDFLAKRAKDRREEVEIDELSNKTMDSYAQKASASQSDAEKKQDYKTADKRIAGKMRASRRKFSNDTNRILNTLKKESKETEDGERDAGSDKYTNYTKEMTPGQGITNPDAKKADVRKKKEQAAQQQQLNVDEDMKYLNTKPGSIEEAILKALMPEAFTTKHEKGDKHDEVPDRKAGESEKDHADRKAGRVSQKAPRKSLDAVDPDELKGKHKDRDDKDIDNDGDVDSSDQYLHRRRQAIASKRTKKEEVETEAFANPPKGMKFPTKGVKNMGGPKTRQLKDPKKEKMVGTKTGTKVVDKNDPRYKNAPEHESVQSPWIEATVKHLDKTVDEKTIMGVKVKKLGTQKDSETDDVRKAQSGDKDALVRQQKRQKFGYKKEDAVDEKTIMGVKVKKLGTQKDSETADVKKAKSGDKDALVRQQRRQKFGYKTS